MRMRLLIKRTPLKRLLAMQPSKAQAFLDRLQRIAANPWAKDNNVKRLTAVPNCFRLRVGDWRASFTLDTESDVMAVFEIEPRGGAYR